MARDSLPLARSIHEISPSWLTAVLRRSGALPTGQVAAFTVSPVGTGQMGASYRLTLTVDAPTSSAPKSVVCKFASDDPLSRQTGIALRTYEVEVEFYREVAPVVDIRTPQCHLAEIDLVTGEFVLVLEDLAPARQGDQIAGCTVHQARLALEELARLHAPRWEDPRLAELAWLNRSTSEAIELHAGLLPSLVPPFLDRFRDRLEPEYVAIAQQLIPTVGDWLRARRGPFSVQHGDYRLDNMLFGTEAGGYPLAVVDWQTVIWGPPVADAAYFLGASLPVELRRQHEKTLLQAYHSELRQRGVRGYGFEQCWADYRRYSISGFLMAIGASVMVVQTERGDEMFLTMARRHGTHILDLDGLEFLR